MARRPAAHLPSGPGSGQGAPAAGVRLEPEARCTTSSRCSPAAERPDEWILRGNHHDAWVNGATDPVCGMVALLAEAQGRRRARPRGLAPAADARLSRPGTARSRGSSARPSGPRAHADELRAKAVAYINTDSNSRGFLYAAGSHTLERLVNEVARDVDDPQSGAPCSSGRGPARRSGGREDDARPPARDARTCARPARLRVRLHAVPPASRHRLAERRLRRRGRVRAVPLDLRLDRALPALHGSGDRLRRDSRQGRRPAQCCASPRPRCCRSSSTRLASAVTRYVEEIEDAGRRDAGRDEEHASAAPRRHLRARRRPDRRAGACRRPSTACPSSSFAPLENARGARHGAERFDAARESRSAQGALARGRSPAQRPPHAASAADPRRRAARAAPGSPHQIYAPGFYTGYGVKTLPAIREAIEQREWKTAEEQAVVTAEVIATAAASIDRAAALLEQRAGQ